MSVVLFIGGWEPTGVAGLAVDLKTAAALDAHAAGVVTAITAQGQGVHAVDLTREDLFAHQLERASQLPISAVKVGMLGSARHVRTLARWLESRPELVVYDPVLRASTGGVLFVSDDLPALRELLPRVGLLTPNLDEAELLCGLPRGSLRGDAAIEDAAVRLLELGAGAVLIKGGHGEGELAQDFYLTRGGARAWLSSPRLVGARGTGCALAAAIACAHSWGAARVRDLIDAVAVGKAYVQRGLRTARALSADEALRALGHGAWPTGADELPWITERAQEGRHRPAAPAMDLVGFYPIVGAAEHIAPLVRAGVTAAQLRVKDRSGAALRRELEDGIKATRGSACRLYVNDHLDAAIELGAYGVHLGQEDLHRVGRAAIERAIAAGLRIGVSTHSYAELARAIAIRPSYVALGPIYPTALKAMPYAPQGPERVREWKRLCAHPIVAIGGITLARVAELGEAAGIALVGDLQVGGDVEARARAYLAAGARGPARS